LLLDRATIAFSGEAAEQPLESAREGAAACQPFLAERRRRRDGVLTLLRLWDLAAAAALVRVFRADFAGLAAPFGLPNSTRPTLSKASAEARKGSVMRGFIVSTCRMFSSACRHDL
jgi:hypothetical protein